MKTPSPERAGSKKGGGENDGVGGNGGGDFFLVVAGAVSMQLGTAQPVAEVVRVSREWFYPCSRCLYWQDIGDGWGKCCRVPWDRITRAKNTCWDYSE